MFNKNIPGLLILCCFLIFCPPSFAFIWENCSFVRFFLCNAPYYFSWWLGWLWSVWVRSAKQVWTVSILIWIFSSFWIVQLTSVKNAFIFVTSEWQIRQHTEFYLFIFFIPLFTYLVATTSYSPNPGYIRQLWSFFLLQNKHSNQSFKPNFASCLLPSKFILMYDHSWCSQCTSSVNHQTCSAPQFIFTQCQVNSQQLVM